jgi:hypothetical protein
LKWGRICIGPWQKVVDLAVGMAFEEIPVMMSARHGHVQSMIRNPEFPDTCKKLPVPRNIFPVNLRRELREK